jgi:hypothetical protein
MGKKSIQELELNKIFMTDDFKQNKEEDKPSKREELLDKLTNEVFNTENIEVRTDINQRQVTSLSKGLLFAEKFESEVLKEFCNNIMKLSLSKDRKSRKEFGEMARSSINRSEDGMIMDEGIKGRLWG